MPPLSTLDWTLEDEAQGRAYRVRVQFSVDAFDPGDRRTPSLGGAARIEDVQVLQVQHFDERGEVRGVDVGAQARRFDARAWDIISSRGGLQERIEAACFAAQRDS